MGINKIKKKAFFFDRDGIVNCSLTIKNKPVPPRCLNELVINDDFIKIYNYLKKQNYYIFVITNQPDVSRGKMSINEAEKINKIITSLFDFDYYYCCYHDNKDNCDFRKPNIGAFKDAIKKFNIDIKSSYMIGDRDTDIVAGNRAGCKTIFIDYEYDETLHQKADYTYKSLINLFNNIDKHG